MTFLCVPPSSHPDLVSHILCFSPRADRSITYQREKIVPEEIWTVLILQVGFNNASKREFLATRFAYTKGTCLP